jgi:hypothetical protein
LGEQRDKLRILIPLFRDQSRWLNEQLASVNRTLARAEAEYRKQSLGLAK